MKGEFWKLDFEAWDEGTVELTLEEEGAYLRICNNLYRRGGHFPNSERLLCALWRCHPNKARSILRRLVEMGKVEIVDETIRNKRVSEEIAARACTSAARAAAGRTGGVKSGETRAGAGKTHRTHTDDAPHTGETNGSGKASKPLKDKDENEALASTLLNQRREEENRDTSSLRSDGADAPAADPIDEDPKAVLFAGGLKWLSEAQRKPESSLRPLVGKMLRDMGGDAYAAQLLGIFRDAKRERKADPVGWIQGVIKTRGARAGPATSPNRRNNGLEIAREEHAKRHHSEPVQQFATADDGDDAVWSRYAKPAVAAGG